MSCCLTHFLYRYYTLKYLHSFPTRRSSDLFLCYYVDGNTKPLWSKKRVKQNKVTMLGRVMGCLEQVFVHDAFGHPVRSEEHTSELQSLTNLVCRLLLEKKNITFTMTYLYWY